jgi:hypothetical protein
MQVCECIGEEWNNSLHISLLEVCLPRGACAKGSRIGYINSKGEEIPVRLAGGCNPWVSKMHSPPPSFTCSGIDSDIRDPGLKFQVPLKEIEVKVRRSVTGIESATFRSQVWHLNSRPTMLPLKNYTTLCNETKNLIAISSDTCCSIHHHHNKLTWTRGSQQ